MKPVDWTKPIQAHDGRKARFVGEILSTGRNYLVAVMGANDVESLYQCYANGDIQNGNPVIVNVPLPLTYEYAACSHPVHGDGVAVRHVLSGIVHVMPREASCYYYSRFTKPEDGGWAIEPWQVHTVTKGAK